MFCKLLSSHILSPPAVGFGSDQDYQLDIISELDLANATYGITQVGGLHNGSKAFLFRGKWQWFLHDHAAPTSQTSSPRSVPCLCAANVRTPFVPLISESKSTLRHTSRCQNVTRGAEIDNSTGAGLIITPHLICPSRQMLRVFLDSLKRGCLRHFCPLFLYYIVSAMFCVMPTICAGREGISYQLCFIVETERCTACGRIVQRRKGDTIGAENKTVKMTAFSCPLFP